MKDEIEISVVTYYLDEQSDPHKSSYVFGYSITIKNNSDEPCQLLNRHWVITNGRGEIEEVKGPGVVGEQPWITPGGQFAYSSGAILKTPVGTMQGSYEFQNEYEEVFDVPIPMFSLAVKHMVH